MHIWNVTSLVICYTSVQAAGWMWMWHCSLGTGMTRVFSHWLLWGGGASLHRPSTTFVHGWGVVLSAWWRPRTALQSAARVTLVFTTPGWRDRRPDDNGTSHVGGLREGRAQRHSAARHGCPRAAQGHHHQPPHWHGGTDPPRFQNVSVCVCVCSHFSFKRIRLRFGSQISQPMRREAVTPSLSHAPSTSSAQTSERSGLLPVAKRMSVINTVTIYVTQCTSLMLIH